MRFLKPLLVIVLLGGILMSISGQGDWRTASRESAGIAPDPAITSEAILHVYGADAWGWRGWFAIHTWIAASARTRAFIPSMTWSAGADTAAEALWVFTAISPTGTGTVPGRGCSRRTAENRPNR